MKLQFKTNENATRFAKRMMFLAYEGINGPTGMGVFQARNNVTEEQVWNNVINMGDYPVGLVNPGRGRIYGDYVFGRMMKFGVEITDTVVSFSDAKLRPDYQGFARKYRTSEELASTALASLDLTAEAVVLP